MPATGSTGLNRCHPKMAPFAENGLFDDLRISLTARHSAAMPRDSQNPDLIQISSFLLGPPFPDAIE